MKDYYKNYFPIGVAVNPQMVRPGPDADLVNAQFNSLTPENAMKMGLIHPEENRYNWKDADAIADFAKQNNLKLRGHTLCWHNQTPRWFFTDSTGNTVSRAVLLARLKRHITDVVGRYKGRIYAWDVVNEAVPDTGDGLYRKRNFTRSSGRITSKKSFSMPTRPTPLRNYSTTTTIPKSHRSATGSTGC